MVNLAATLVGAFCLWVVFSPSASAQEIGLGVFAIVAAALAAARFRGPTLESAAAPPAPDAFLAAASDACGSFFKAVKYMCVQAAQPTAGSPALLRVRTRLEGAPAHLAFAQRLSVTPGVIVIDMDDAGILAHALDEGQVDPVALGRLETRAARAGMGDQA